MTRNRVFSIAAAAILFGGGLIALLYFADQASSRSLHLALSVSAGIVAMSGIIVVNGLLSLGGPSQAGAGSHPESSLHDKEAEGQLGQVAHPLNQLQPQTIQQEQASRQQKHREVGSSMDG